MSSKIGRTCEDAPELVRLLFRMSTPIHGHEIIHLVSSQPDGLSIAQLTETVAKQFGSSPRFFTCSAENLTLDELLAFLNEREKVRLLGDSVYPGKSPACNH